MARTTERRAIMRFMEISLRQVSDGWSRARTSWLNRAGWPRRMVAYEEMSRGGKLGGGYSARYLNRWVDRLAVDELQEKAWKPLPGCSDQLAWVQWLPLLSRWVPGHSAAIPSSSPRCSRTSPARRGGWMRCSGGPTRCPMMRSSRELPSVAGRPASGREHLPALAESRAGPRSSVRRVGETVSSP